MRDLFLVLLFPIFLYYTFRTPIIALYLWFWTSMYPMSNWLYGFGLSLRFNLVFSLITIFGYIFTIKDKPLFKPVGLFVLVIVFWAHSVLGVYFYGNTYYQWNTFDEFSKIIIFFIFCTLMVRKQEHFEALLMFLCLGLGFLGLMEGLKYIVTAGSHNVIGMKGPLGDNNKVALGLNMMIPLMLYLFKSAKHIRIKQLYLAVIVGSVFAVLGTDSRGGFLALAFMAIYYWWSTGRNFSVLFLIGLIAVPALFFLPEEWFQRMDTMNSAESDSSFVNRVTFWKINLLVAFDYPLTGIGFDTSAFPVIWKGYTNSLSSIYMFVDTPPPNKGFVAHSIYFEVLGNQGLLGFLLFISIILTALNNIKTMIKQYGKQAWESKLLQAVKVSLLTYCVGGAALNAAYFELFYLLIAFVICFKLKLIANDATKNKFK